MQTLHRSLCRFLDENDRNYVEPDISVICDPDKLNDKGCSGAPDWIIEIVSPGSRRMDYFTKLFKYRTAGVREYWIVDPDRNRITVYDFESEDTQDYTFSSAVKTGIYEDPYQKHERLYIFPWSHSSTDQKSLLLNSGKALTSTP